MIRTGCSRRLSVAIVIIGGTLAATGTVAQDRQPSGQAGNVIVSKSTGMKLVSIPAGAFEMGSLLSEDGHSRKENQHTVRISRAFHVGMTEITQGDYESVMRTNPSEFSGTEPASSRVSGTETSQLPVENVSWYDAVEFCNKLSSQEDLKEYYGLTEIERDKGSIKSAVVTLIGGAGYRLPTEAEWEYACRSRTTTSYHAGETVSLLAQAGWYGGQKAPIGNSQQRPHSVAQKAANGFGLFDMHGNVSEWCQDWYDDSSYDRLSPNDPAGPATGTSRVVRGGSWNDVALNCRSARRDSRPAMKRSNEIGFRVVRSVQQPRPQNPVGIAPYRIVIDLRDGGTVDVFNNETYDTIDNARQRLAGSKLFGRISNIRIIDHNGNQID